MARVEVPDGNGPEQERVWAIHPKFGAAAAKLSATVYGHSILPARVREAARMRIARINDCPN